MVLLRKCFCTSCDSSAQRDWLVFTPIAYFVSTYECFVTHSGSFSEHIKKTCYSYPLQNYTFIQSCQFNTNELKTQGNYNIECITDRIMFLEYSNLDSFGMILDKCA